MNKIVIFGIMVIDMVVEVDKFPLEGETILGNNYSEYFGGKGFNQAIAAKRLGGNVEFIGSVGNDIYGERFTNVLKQEKVQHNRLKVVDSRPTGVAQIQVDGNGQNKITVIPLANHEYTLDSLMEDSHVFEDASIAVFQLEMLEEVTYEAIRLASKAGVTIILNPAPSPNIPKDILELVDYLIPNDIELGLLTNMNIESLEDVEIASKKLLDLGVKNVITTMGSKGAFVANSENSILVESLKVDSVIDTVAAGDSFIGGFAVMISENKSIMESVIFANTVGELTVQVKGALPSLHKRVDVIDLLKKRGNFNFE